MRWRVLLLVSLGVNLALGATVWFIFARQRDVWIRAGAGSEAALPQRVRTNLLVRREYFNWSQVESPDYRAYIANLRGIGCPEQTIRDIIIADVNALYARKLATEVITPAQQWWRSRPDPAVVKAAAAKIRQLEADRRALLTSLLGTNWESGDLANLPRPSHPGVVLDGPVLGVLPAGVKQAVQDITDRAQKRLAAYLNAQQEAGKNADPVALAKLQRQTRDELAHILTPPQLEEFLLRYSQDANSLRSELSQLQYFDATPDEFRALFRATDSIDQQLALLADSTDSNSTVQRDALLRQREAAIRTALGPERYREYQLLQDPDYRQAVATAQNAGDPDAVRQLYQINAAAAQQLATIQANTNLSATQREIQLKQAELEALQAQAVALGQQTNAPPPPPPQPPPIRTHPFLLGVGQSAATVAMRYGISLSELQAVNPGVDLNQLQPGQVIRVPDSLPAR